MLNLENTEERSRGPDWRLKMLGGLQLQKNGLSIPLPGTRKAHLLLAYLAYHLPKLQLREELIDIFWPESLLETGRNSLNNALSKLRSVLEPRLEDRNSILASTSASIGLRADAFTTDIADLEKAQRLAHSFTSTNERILYWGHVIELYSGAFLPGCYEDWALAGRAHFEVAYQEAIQYQVHLLKEAGNLDTAMRHAQEAVQRSPGWEYAHAELIHIYDLKGLPSIALRQFGELERVLADLGDVPSETLQDWAKRARRQSVLPGVLSPVPAASPLFPSASASSFEIFATSGFYGREKVTNSLVALLKDALFTCDQDSQFAEGSFPSNPKRAGVLLTLTGPAGAGKTRLAQEAITNLSRIVGVCTAFVPLESLSNASLIPAAIVKALGDEKATNPMDQVVQRLTDSPSLIVLDNLEHLLPEGHGILTTLLERLPETSWLVTSRRPLGMPGEHEVAVEPLPVPSEDTIDIHALWQYPSVQLFVDRAQVARPQFMLTPENAPSVANLCRRLDGLPLALEMVAAWTRVLTPNQMLARLVQQHDLLVSRLQGQSDRHASLEAALEWGWRLLAPAVQISLVELNVFRGGWTLDAAEAICREPLLLEYLTQLQEQSWVVAEEKSDGMRFRMLTTIRDFLSSKSDSDDQFRKQHHSLRTRHAAYFLDAVTQGGPAQNVPVQDEWLIRLSADQDNVRAALDWCLEKNSLLGLRLAVALHGFWKSRGLFQEGTRYLLALLQSQPEAASDILQSWGFNALGALLQEMGEFSEARNQLVKAQHFALRSGDQYCLSRASGNLGRVLLRQEQYEQAERLISEHQEFSVAFGDRLGEMMASQDLGLMKLYQGNYTEAQRLLARATVLAEEFKDRTCLADALTNQALSSYLQASHDLARPLLERALHIYGEMRENSAGRLCALDLLGTIEMEAGRYEAARSHYEEVMSVSRRTGNRFNLAASTGNLGFVTLRQGLLRESGAAFRESLTLCHAMSETRIATSVLEGMSQLALAQGKALPAARLLGASQVLRRTLGRPVAPSEQQELDQIAQNIRDLIGETSFLKETTFGGSLHWDDAVEYALSLYAPS